jgi:flagellar hook assembly protein FlgD
MVDQADSLRKIDAETPDYVVRVRAEVAGLITVAIRDAKGILMKILSGRSAKAGEYALLWDGRDQEGNPCSKGIYYYQVLGSSKLSGGGVILIR